MGIQIEKMKLSLLFVGAFSSELNNNYAPVMERAIGAVACLERDTLIRPDQPGQCWAQFLKGMEECEAIEDNAPECDESGPSFDPGQCFAKVNTCVFSVIGGLMTCSAP